MTSQHLDPDEGGPPGANSREPARPGFGLTSATLRGLPELGYFESPQQREAALREIESEASNPKSFDFWFGVMLTAAAPILTFFLSRMFLRRIISLLGVTGLDRVVEILLVAGVAWATVRTLHRRGLISAVREKLIARGIAVCRGCGYLLRGLGPGSGRCPECGRRFDVDVETILRDATGGRGGDGGVG
ncbi:MAG: hypothetical protein FLDDKLPJ_01818 [Phycisphaerae bacterium]|nr:hypothetical protein [Phycisphaerae bacterium]